MAQKKLTKKQRSWLDSLQQELRTMEARCESIAGEVEELNGDE